MILLTILIFIIILGLLVFVHELGHFVMAKRAGMKVEEFGFGFPPRMFGIKRGETIYSVNWIPLGGFVRILGEDGQDDQNPESFGNKSGWRRFSVLVAGVTMNFILAWFLLSIGLAIGLPTVISEGEELPTHARTKSVSVTVVDTMPDAPAAAAGIKVGDKILKINDEPIDSIEEAQSLTSKSAGSELTYVLKRGSTTFEKKIVPRANPPEGQGPLGVALSSVAIVSYPWYQAIPRGLEAAVSLLVATVTAFAIILKQWLTGHSVGQALSGPVGIAVLTRDVAQLGFIYLLQFTALLSINLAVINAAPFPALDGGRILFLIIEKLRGKKLHQKAEQIANTVGFFVLIALMLLVTIRDVGKFNLIDKIKDLL